MRTTRALALFLVLAACGAEHAPAAPAPARQEPAAQQPAAPSASAPQASAQTPKPGQRVRQPLLDSHCGEAASPTAFYYHGGNPVAQRALGDGCRPLYLVECSDEGTCTENREQEPGMWCCGAPSPSTQTAHAERRSETR